ncbi:hypothetical protein J8F10_36550 [Gemmata sp. G18]|uniref:Uncharacterized protein n=1 Tax=Gemmata palustris TaxID=2822762 RepID=A0ABS5C445_9BACT|nr:hypothetical protein [Gemmata palustris]MBP3960764.1 hypothetical protein [Gemmata palustris]
MFGIFGLGGPEILILVCCATVPVGAAGIAFAVIRLSAQKAKRDDFDDETDDQ